MNYSITATANSGDHEELMIKESTIAFGTTEKSAKELPNPAELFLGAFAACILKISLILGILGSLFLFAAIESSTGGLATASFLLSLLTEVLLCGKSRKNLKSMEGKVKQKQELLLPLYLRSFI